MVNAMKKLLLISVLIPVMLGAGKKQVRPKQELKVFINDNGWALLPSSAFDGSPWEQLAGKSGIEVQTVTYETEIRRVEIPLYTIMPDNSLMVESRRMLVLSATRYKKQNKIFTIKYEIAIDSSEEERDTKYYDTHYYIPPGSALMLSLWDADGDGKFERMTFKDNYLHPG